MAFFQTPPELGNQYTHDRVLRDYLERTLPESMRREIEPELSEIGELAGGDLYQQLTRERLDEPVLTQWDAWGNRVDHIELTPLWKRVSKLAASYGLVGTAYEKKNGAFSRIHQFTKVYLLDGSTAVYSCPLAMTDGAAKTLLVSGNKELAANAIPRLAHRDPEKAWTSGQWMTERTGGSDVAITESVAKLENGEYRLYGTKWFSSATTANMALTLARPEGNPPGGSGLALFYVEVRNADGSMNNIRVNRLKDKLGTRMVPTAELTLEGTRAVPVSGLTGGIKNITPMLSVTRTWNAIGAITGMRRGLALAKDYAARRVAFGAPLAHKPLHIETLADVEAEYEGAFLFAFRVVELLGKEEDGSITEEEKSLLRLLTPIVKLTTGKQAVAAASEILEAFGGAGYVEDTGLPRLLRDAQVLSIWEGTTNVLSLDLLRALSRGTTLDPIGNEMQRCASEAPAELREEASAALKTLEHARTWLLSTLESGGPDGIEAGARRLAMSIGRAYELALLVKEAGWLLSTKKSRRGIAAAKRFYRHGVDLISDSDTREEAALLLA